ncbi:Tom22p [Ascoidea rubescens DSM 1968]|uniref:Mitochondrial import translocase, subunit Tom22 n=1 Tax=Ascoidea rubescens DSM 1968 TaxID=1344418 RepID=A0A1D2VKA9_9ASCO|nr:mitochondrial import translocase, subunit Tom22 [Ascoidea rubescens DSM 1968]ODV62033.1 mitochondrial import translocase, subunit Tom22 [Ascoidea rubescens DSM 1968]
MVKLTQLDENNQPVEDSVLNDNDFETTSESDSENSEADSDDDDFDIENETILDRIVALKDIIPIEQRSIISDTTTGLYSFLSNGISKTGNLLWIITSSCLLLGVPLSLSILSEQQLLEMEKEFNLQQQTNDVLAPGSTNDAFQPLPSQPAH